MSEPCGRSLRPHVQGLRECQDYAQRPSRSIPGKREATNFYVWESEDAAKAFFTDDLLERVTGLYGVRPTVEFDCHASGERLSMMLSRVAGREEDERPGT